MQARMAFLSFIAALALICSAGAEGDKCFMWKVESEGSTVHLLGSMHYAAKDFYPLAGKIEEAFGKADYLVVEVDIADIDPMEMQQQVLQKGMYPAGDNIEGHVSPETYRTLKEYLKKNRLPLGHCKTMKPWLLSLSLSSMKLTKMGITPEYGIDMHFITSAKEKGKKILELETFAGQLDMLADLGDEEQDCYLRSTLADLENVESDMKKIIRAWKTGDSEEMAKMVFKSLADTPELAGVYEKLFFRRNREMAAKIEEFLKSGKTYFVVVGAGHLAGEGSIVELLRNENHTVEQQ